MQNSEGSFQPVNPKRPRPTAPQPRRHHHPTDGRNSGWTARTSSSAAPRWTSSACASATKPTAGASSNSAEPSPPTTPDRPSTFAVELDSYLLAGIAGPELGRLFSGRIDTLPSAKSNFLTFTPGPNPMPRWPSHSATPSLPRSNSMAFPFLFGLCPDLGRRLVPASRCSRATSAG